MVIFGTKLLSYDIIKFQWGKKQNGEKSKENLVLG